MRKRSKHRKKKRILTMMKTRKELRKSKCRMGDAEEKCGRGNVEEEMWKRKCGRGNAQEEVWKTHVVLKNEVAFSKVQSKIQSKV